MAAGQQLMAALQRVAAADDDTLDAAIADVDLDSFSQQQQMVQLLVQEQRGVVLAAALARCLRALVNRPATAAAGNQLQHERLWRCATNFAGTLCIYGIDTLLQIVCSTGLPDVLPAACQWLTPQLMPEPAQQQNRQQRRQQQRQQQRQSTLSHMTAESWWAASLANYVAVLFCTIGLAATSARAAANSTAATAAAKVPAAATLAAVAPLAAAFLLWYQRCHDSLAAAAVGSTTQQQRQKVEADQDKLKDTFKLAALLTGMCGLVPDAEEQGAQPEALVAAAPPLPWLAAVSLAGLAAAKHRAAGGMSAMPLPGAAGASAASVPAHHSALLAQLGMPSLEAAISEEFEPISSSMLSLDVAQAIIGSGSHVLRGRVPAIELRSSSSSGGSSSSIDGLGSTQLSVASVRLLRSVLAELMVLDAEPSMQAPAIGMFGVVADALRNMGGRQDDAPGDEEALSLLLTMVLPAVQHAAAADSTANPATTSSAKCASLAQKALHIACKLIVVSLLHQGYDFSVFDSQLFLQHPAAVLSGLEAVVRHDVCNRSANGSMESSVSESALLILHQAGRSSGLCSWLQEAVSAQAAGSCTAREASSNCSRLLCLLVTCTKGMLVLAEQGHASGSFWQFAGAQTALSTCALTHKLFVAVLRGTAAARRSSGDVHHQPQQLLYGFDHLLGRSLAAAGGMIAAVLPPSAAAGVDSVPAPAAAAAAAAPAAQPSGSDVAKVVQPLQAAVKFVGGVLPVLSTPGYSQQQLLEPLEAWAAAAAAVEKLWSSPAARAEAEAAAAASEDAGDTRAVLLWLLRFNPAVAQQLVQALVAMGNVLCAALPTKHACNDPACACCDKASEQQLVSGKGSMCSACRVARYCSVEHQHRHWRAHKPACKALAAAAAASGGGDRSSSSKEKKSKAAAGGGGSSSRRRGG